MSTFTTPATWSASALTVAQMNTEVRDHLVWLKAALDMITESTSADTGDTARVHVNRGVSTNVAYSTKVTGDSNNRLSILASNKINFGGGAAATDTELSRSGVNELTSSGRILAPAFQPTSTTDALNIPNGYIEINERSTGDPAAPAANWARIWLKDNGAGKSQLMIRFSSGANQVIATQP